MKKFFNADTVRLFILGIILAGTMIVHYLHINGNTGYPSVHAICPLGGLENLWAWIAGRGNLQKLFSGTMSLFFFTIIFALVFGRSFCGYICPFGALQEFIGKITKKKLLIPEKTDKYLRLFKYLVLIFVTVMAWITASLWISPYDPYVAFAHIWAGKSGIMESGIIGFVILVIVLLASVFIDRFFCKYLCPAGALYGIITKISPSRITRKKDCSSCGLCSKVCPANIAVDRSEKIKSPECIYCGKCVNVCPAKNSDIKITIFGKTAKPPVFIIGIVFIFFLGIFVLDRTGLFQVTIPSMSSVEKSGNYLKISDLRGSMSIEVGAFYAGIELQEFYRIMEIPKNIPKEMRLKDVSLYVPGWEFHAIKGSR